MPPPLPTFVIFHVWQIEADPNVMLFAKKVKNNMTTEKTFFFEYGIALYFLFGFNIQIGKLLANQRLAVHYAASYWNN